MSYIEQELQHSINDLIYYPKNSKPIQLGNSIVGFYTPQILFEKLTLEYNLFSKYRHQGLGNSFVEEATKLVEEEYSMYDKIFLLIHMNNLPSISVACNNGYLPYYDEDLQNKIMEEMPNYYLYYKENEFYQKPKQLLHKL